MKEHLAEVLVIGVESSTGTKIPGTGAFVDGDYETPFIRKGSAEGVFDERCRVTERDAIRRILELRDIGVFAGPQTGAVVHAALAVAHRHGVEGDIVVISGDAGWKNFERLMPTVGAEASV